MIDSERQKHKIYYQNNKISSGYSNPYIPESIFFNIFFIFLSHITNI